MHRCSVHMSCRTVAALTANWPVHHSSPIAHAERCPGHAHQPLPTAAGPLTNPEPPHSPGVLSLCRSVRHWYTIGRSGRRRRWPGHSRDTQRLPPGTRLFGHCRPLPLAPSAAPPATSRQRRVQRPTWGGSHRQRSDLSHIQGRVQELTWTGRGRHQLIVWGVFQRKPGMTDLEVETLNLRHTNVASSDNGLTWEGRQPVG